MLEAAEMEKPRVRVEVSVRVELEAEVRVELEEEAREESCLKLAS